MKNKMTKILGLGIILAAFSTGVNAQTGATATDQATATAIIVTPLSISKTVDMHFGNVAVGGSAGTVVLTPAGARSRTGGVTLPAVPGPVAAASFTVQGQGTYTYAITLPTTDLTIDDNSSNTMIVNTFTSTPSGTGLLSAGGSQTLTVGATLNVSANQPAGTYTSDTPFDVTVVYN